ncbi:MAG: hypothetical protein IJ131_10790, partial [Eggerthellaceae bacterium]|nr:hypothetical protein [Eggerthellaceae bacterium]
MSSVILAISLLLILVFSWRIFNRQLAHPSILFTAPFFAAAVNGLLNYERYQFELRWNTVFLVAGGSLVFSAVCYGIEYALATRCSNLLERRSWIRVDNTSERNEPLYLPGWAYALGLAITLGSVYVLVTQMTSISIANDGPADILGAMRFVDHISKFTNIDTSFRGLAGHYIALSNATTYMWAYLFARNLFSSERIFDWR